MSVGQVGSGGILLEVNLNTQVFSFAETRRRTRIETLTFRRGDESKGSRYGSGGGYRLLEALGPQADRQKSAARPYSTHGHETVHQNCQAAITLLTVHCSLFTDHQLGCTPEYPCTIAGSGRRIMLPTAAPGATIG